MPPGSCCYHPLHTQTHIHTQNTPALVSQVSQSPSLQISPCRFQLKISFEIQSSDSNEPHRARTHACTHIPPHRPQSANLMPIYLRTQRTTEKDAVHRQTQTKQKKSLLAPHCSSSHASRGCQLVAVVKKKRTYTTTHLLRIYYGERDY